MTDRPIRTFTTWDEVKKYYGWVGSEPIAKMAKQFFEVRHVQRYDESDADFKKRVEPRCHECGGTDLPHESCERETRERGG